MLAVVLTIVVCRIVFAAIQAANKNAECKEYAEKNGLSGYYNHKGDYINLK